MTRKTKAAPLIEPHAYQLVASVDPGEKFSRATYEAAYLVACKLILQYEKRHPTEILAAANFLALHVSLRMLKEGLAALESGRDVELIRLGMLR